VRLALGAVAAAGLALTACSGGVGDRSVDDASRTPESVASATTPQGPESATAPTGDGVVVGEEVEQAVLEAAAADGLVRWPAGPVTVGWSGRVTARDEEILRDAVRQLATLTGLELRATGAGSAGPDTDVEVVFAPPGEWPVTPDDEPTHVLGVTEARWSDGELIGAVVAVDSTIEQSLRNQTIVHELVHAIGVGHVACPTSIIHGGSGGSPTWVIGPLDEELVRTWYDPRLPPGASASVLATSIEGTPGGPTCEAVSFELVRTPAGDDGAEVLWCETGAGAQPCVAVDGLRDPPVAPLTDPVRWVLDRTVYDHDPTRYEAVQVEGRRALCELEGGNRRPCQFTDGPGPLTGVDFWTDGTFLYESP
jgi:hypothetical protein